jgi:nucleoside-diphosphate-sugar epimerase
MIGSALISQLVNEGYNILGLDCKEKITTEYKHIVINLSDKEKVADLFSSYKIYRVIHLAALAHTAGEDDLSYEKYFEINVNCAKNVFEAAFLNKVPVLYVSTADVYGFIDGAATAQTPLRPISDYGKTKALAENELKTLSLKFKVPYTIYRFAPVYTSTVKRDI